MAVLGVAGAALEAAAPPGGGDMANSASRIFRHCMTTPWRLKRIFSAAGLANIEAAISAAELQHGGEIRFAVEAALDFAPLFAAVSARQRALDAFSTLRAWDTEHNNGVLIYLLLADRDVEIVADRGFNNRVDTLAWQQICAEMEQAFSAGDYEAGVLAGIARVSKEIAQHFPLRDNDRNELENRPTIL